MRELMDDVPSLEKVYKAMNEPMQAGRFQLLMPGFWFSIANKISSSNNQTSAYLKFHEKI